MKRNDKSATKDISSASAQKNQQTINKGTSPEPEAKMAKELRDFPGSVFVHLFVVPLAAAIFKAAAKAAEKGGSSLAPIVEVKGLATLDLIFDVLLPVFRVLIVVIITLLKVK